MRGGGALRLRALGHPVRLRLIELLSRRRSATVGDLADSLGMSASVVSKHLRELARAGLVRRAQEGNFASYKLAYPECWQLVVITYRLVARDAKDMLALGASLVDVDVENPDEGDLEPRAPRVRPA
jgi:ArsR family transcriptional regulator